MFSFLRQVAAFESVNLATINQTFLVAIPKVRQPEYIHQFRLIGYLRNNVNCKIVTKILVNKLKNLMPRQLVSKFQSQLKLREKTSLEYILKAVIDCMQLSPHVIYIYIYNHVVY